jgi:Spy/CpxP family protein refolding chaperone
MLLRKSLFAVLGTILALSMIAFAQEPQTSPPASQDGTLQRERMERRREHLKERMGRREGMEINKRREGLARHAAGMGRLGRELNLTEAQREQSRAIMQRRLANTKTQREELFRLREKKIAGTFAAEDEARAKALREEIRQSMEGVRTEMESVLTAEQKAKLETLKTERKALHEQRMQERQERRKERLELRNKPQ